jgi:hypothetical protein
MDVVVELKLVIVEILLVTGIMSRVVVVAAFTELQPSNTNPRVKTIESKAIEALCLFKRLCSKISSQG